MENNISLTIPLQIYTLEAAATMLLELADEIRGGKRAPTPIPPSSSPVVDNSGQPGASSEEQEESEYCEDCGFEIEICACGKTGDPDPAAVFATKDQQDGNGDPDPDPGNEPPPGIEVDDAGLPWDKRIHSSGKSKYASTNKKEGKIAGCWQYKRGVDPELIETVEAELRSAMSASPDNPIVEDPAASSTAAPPPPNEDDGTAPPPPPQNAATEGVDINAITTMPELMQAVTKAKIDQPTVLAACQKQGLAAVPLLGTRPDLIPAVAADLFGSAGAA